MKTATCHPERRHRALGLCEPCYHADWRSRNPHDKVVGQARDARRYAATKKRADYARLQRARSLRHAFGITIDEYERLLEQQRGKCAICGEPETAMRNGRVKYLAVDHDHVTGVVRGLLCQRCNTMIGKGGDSPDILRAAIRYLEDHGHP